MGDNLRLRFAVTEDFEAWSDFNERMREYGSSAAGNAIWAHELMSGKHPTTRAGDFTVVEDVRAGKIVSSLCEIPQTWSYGGISFGCGRIEHVGTDPAYRRRGLIRAQLDVIHALSASKGELMQSITGIPWYYRQFGYEYAIDLSYGRVVSAPQANRESKFQYCVRPLTESDHAFVRSVYDHNAQRQPFSVVRSDEHWAWEFSGRTTDSAVYKPWLIIADAAQSPVGYIHHFPLLSTTKPHLWHLVVNQCAIDSGESYVNVVPDLPPGLSKYVRAQGNNGQVGEFAQPGEIVFMLGRDDPLYAGLQGSGRSSSWGNAWYIRIPDLAAYLRHLRPALEKHLLGTPAEGYTGALTLDFYQSGLRLDFERGKITDIENLNHREIGASDASFPCLTFLQLLGGRRTVDELKESYPDCTATPVAQALLTALFPPFTGNLWHSD